MRNIRAVYALRRAISAVCAVACSSLKMTITWPGRSTTAAAGLEAFDLHALIVPSAAVFALADARNAHRALRRAVRDDRGVRRGLPPAPDAGRRLLPAR